MPLPPTTASAARRADVGALALVGGLAVWTALVAGGGEGRSAPVLLLLAGLVAAVLLGRRLAGWPGLVPKALASAIAGAFALTYPGLLGAGGAPTGYANSNATLAAVGVVAAVASARQAPAGRERQAWTAVAATLVVATLLTRSTAGIAVLALAGALLLLATWSRWPPVVAVGGAVATSLVLGLSVLLAVDDSAPLAGSDVVRVELWSAAVDLAREEPVRGLGPGAFEARNPVTQDADLRWVHHEYLELAVELGGVGVVLVVALGLAVLARLALAGGDGTTAAAAVTIVAVHGTVDHVWHAPALLLVSALLVGGATVWRTGQRPPSVAEVPPERT
ncbi:O-antigen ligase family protein [Acidimicrobiia bacterium EGI L10123]|uniref:O-antigen ligase family protein n=1 Tax=Salinilacustrithrix flava TaxID=2957203 RepID=UPI003D7C20DD|nr:O-antigen ligase family protein [Acidimicrobiia bacterium EGI L10123]